MDFAYIGQTILRLLPYTLVTLQVVLQAFLYGCLFGGLLAWAKVSGHPVLSRIANGYTTVIRCTPFIIMLFLVFYGSPYLLSPFGIDANAMDKQVFTVITLSMYSASNLSDNFRAAYLSVNKGQREAALCVGMSETQAMVRIVLPQMIFIALPMISNVIVSEFQDTALAFSIGLVDLMGQAKVLDAITYNVHTVSIYIAVALMFWVLAILVERIIKIWHDYLGDRKHLNGYGNRA